jgi:hypothetical protein
MDISKRALILHDEIGRGWQNGIKLDVFFAAIVPIMTAVIDVCVREPSHRAFACSNSLSWHTGVLTVYRVPAMMAVAMTGPAWKKQKDVGEPLFSSRGALYPWARAARHS